MRPIKHIGNGDPVYRMPKDGICPICEDYIADDVAEHDNEWLCVCIGCGALYQAQEVVR